MSSYSQIGTKMMLSQLIEILQRELDEAGKDLEVHPAIYANGSRPMVDLEFTGYVVTDKWAGYIDVELDVSKTGARFIRELLKGVARGRFPREAGPME
jgi:hypothetical protein